MPQERLAQKQSVTLAKCVLAVFVLLIGGLGVAHGEKAERAMETITLFGFDPPETAWVNIDDVVMGGVSSSRMNIEDSIARFEGELSLENNGGFASVRSGAIASDLGEFAGIRIRVKGDGKQYQFRIQSDATTGGVAYALTFETEAGVWSEIALPFSEFKATFRGRELPDYPPLDSATIRSVAFLIAAKQEGPFCLEIDWIRAYAANREE